VLWIGAAALALLAGASPRGVADAIPVEVIARDAERRVDVLVAGTPFTSYRYGTSAKKPILFPLRSARGTLVTRGVPIEPRPGERADHPHHAGHWFNHGEVNGYDFWGHSDQTPAANRPKMGTIVHTGVTRTTGGSGSGTLAVTADWVVPDGSTLIRESTEFVFHAAADQRTIDRVTTWTAASGPVVFGDTKEGSFGIRVARSLEHRSDQGGSFVNQAGEQTTVAKMDPAGATGRYLASDGTTGEAVWGTRGPWMALTGTVDGEAVTLAILDHPRNPGHPTRWHARGYGLFSANPFGQKGFDPKLPLTPTTLPAGAALTFRHRIVIHSGHLTRDAMQQEYNRFTSGKRW
jgi:hypothetical protein